MGAIMKTKRKTAIKKQKTSKQRRVAMSEIHSDASESIKAAKRGEQHADREAKRSRADAEAAGTEVERLAEALRQKDGELAKVTARCEALKAELSGLALDDPGAEKPSGQLLHATIIKDKVTKEREALHGSLVAAQERADHLRQAAEVAEAAARNAQRWVGLQRLREQFPSALDILLRLVSERNDLLTAADEESRAFDLPRLGRARLFMRRDQLRQDEMDALAIILTRHSSGLVLVPSGPLSALALEQDLNGDGEESAEERVEPDVLTEAGDPEEIPDQDLTEAEWAALTSGEGGEIDG
jgi:hypothetical protein